MDDTLTCFMSTVMTQGLVVFIIHLGHDVKKIIIADVEGDTTRYQYNQGQVEKKENQKLRRLIRINRMISWPSQPSDLTEGGLSSRQPCLYSMFFYP